MVLVYSATKGLAAMTLAVAHSRGWLDYEERVCTLLARVRAAGQGADHRPSAPGAPGRAVRVRRARRSRASSRTSIAWPSFWRVRSRPGSRARARRTTRSALGFYEGELLRRVDPRHRSLGQFFQDEIASPLGLDVYIRLPEAIPNARLATLTPPGRLEMLVGFPLRLTLDAMNPRSNIYRALDEQPGHRARRSTREHVYARNLEVPSGGAVGTARGIAHAYGVFASGGRELGLRQETLDLLAAPAIPPDARVPRRVPEGRGAVLARLHEAERRHGRSAAPSSFGSPGAGGSMGFADPDAGIGYGYVTSQMGTTLTGDPRDVALRDALYAAIRA